MIDPDLGWHLAIGEHFLNYGEVIRGDPFSWTMSGYVFGNYYFLYEIIVAYLFGVFGYAGTVLIFGVIASTSFLILLPKRLGIWQMLVAMLGVSMVVSTLGVRPSTVSLLFFSVMLILLHKQALFDKRSGFFWLLFFCLWANFHQGFLAGLALFYIFLVAKFLGAKSTGKRFVVGDVVILICAAGVGIFLTPFQFGVLHSISLDLFGRSMWSAISEWQSIVQFMPLSLLYLGSVLIFTYILFKRFADFNVESTLLFAVTCLLPFLAVAFTPFWAAVFVYFAARYLDFDLKLDRLTQWMFGIVMAAIALVIGLNFLTEFIGFENLGHRLETDKYPRLAVSFMQERRLTNKVFNFYSWGGYMIWKAPPIPVFIDGRMTGWRRLEGSSILEDYRGITRGERCELVEKYKIETVLFKADEELICFDDFLEVYRDDAAKVLVRK